MGNDDARKKILSRRARFVTAALTGVVIGCGGKSEDVGDVGPSVCLSDTGGAVVDTGPMPCLDPLPPDTGLRDSATDMGSDATDTSPMVCLSDVGSFDSSAEDTATDTADTGPMPCLAPPP